MTMDYSKEEAHLTGREMSEAVAHFQQLCQGRQVSKKTLEALAVFEKFQDHLEGTAYSQLVFYYP